MKCPQKLHRGSGGALFQSKFEFPPIAANQHEADLIVRVTVKSILDCLDTGTFAFAISGGDSDGRTSDGWVNVCPYSTWKLLNAVLHEVLHILGVADFLPEANPIWQQDYALITSPQVVQKAREFFQCPAILGMPSHWPDWFVEDIASPAVGPQDITSISGASLEDTGFYIIDYSKTVSQSRIHKGCEQLPAMMRFPVKVITLRNLEDIADVTFPY